MAIYHFRKIAKKIKKTGKADEAFPKELIKADQKGKEGEKNPVPAF
jgi:hypothetical protein